MWNLLNSKVGLLVLGFYFYNCLWGLFTQIGSNVDLGNTKSCLNKNDKILNGNAVGKFELLRRKLDEGQKSLEEISDLINLRFYRLQKVYEAIVFRNLNSIESQWNEYVQVVEKWNCKTDYLSKQIEKTC